MKGRRTTANSSDRFWEDRRKSNESQPALMLTLVQSWLWTDQRKTHYRIIDKETTTKIRTELFHKHQFCLQPSLYHLSLKSLNNILLIKASLLRVRKANGGTNFHVGHKLSFNYWGMWGLFLYTSGWIAPKITAKIMANRVGFFRRNILIHPISSC